MLLSDCSEYICTQSSTSFRFCNGSTFRRLSHIIATTFISPAAELSHSAASSDRKRERERKNKAFVKTVLLFHKPLISSASLFSGFKRKSAIFLTLLEIRENFDSFSGGVQRSRDVTSWWCCCWRFGCFFIPAAAEGFVQFGEIA